MKVINRKIKRKYSKNIISFEIISKIAFIFSFINRTESSIKYNTILSSICDKDNECINLIKTIIISKILKKDFQSKVLNVVGFFSIFMVTSNTIFHYCNEFTQQIITIMAVSSATSISNKKFPELDESNLNQNCKKLIKLVDKRCYSVVTLIREFPLYFFGCLSPFVIQVLYC